MEQEKKDIYFMGLALREAQKAYLNKEVPVGTVIVYQDQVIAKGYNQVELLKDPTAHSEVLAITAAASYFNDWRLLKTTLYTTLEPCLMCAGAILSARISRLVWGAPDLRVGANGSWIDVFEKKHPIHELEIIKNVLKDESAFLMKSFFQEQRKVKEESSKQNKKLDRNKNLELD